MTIPPRPEHVSSASATNVSSSIPLGQEPPPSDGRERGATGHRRHLVVLASAQILSGLGNGAGLALGALLAAELSGSEAWGGSVAVAISLAGTLVSIPLARLAMAAGRRPALTLGYSLGAVGAVGMIVSAAVDSFPLLLLSALLLGVASATNLQARFAATDGSAPGRKARDLSLVVWALTIGATTGPSLAGPGASLAASLGLPTNAGAFLFSAVGLVLAASAVFIGLRPDPLPKGEAAAGGASKPSLAEGWRALSSSRGAGVGVVAVFAAHACMVAVMSMTTIHLQHVHGGGSSVVGHHVSADTLTIVGITLSGHIAGMYALSPLVGWLVDRWGHRATLLIAQALFAASALACVVAPEQVGVVSVALFVLGLAWSFATIAGAAVVAERVPAARRVAAQGFSDAAMSTGGVLAGLVSGVLLTQWGYRGLNLASLVIAVGIAALVAWRLPRARREVEASAG